MKQILKILMVVGVVLLAALISAGSCDKKGGDKSNSGDSGSLVLTNAKTGIAKIDDATGTVTLKASALIDVVATTIGNLKIILDSATKAPEAFSIEYKGAEAGLVVLTRTTVANATKLSVATEEITSNSTTGVHADGTAAMKVYSAIIENGFPEWNNSRPVIYCVATTKVPAFAGKDLATDTTTRDGVLGATLEGGQKAVCHAGALAVTVSDQWIDNVGANSTQKFNIIGLKVDKAKKLSDILVGNDAAAKAGTLGGGLTADEMKAIVDGANVTAAVKEITIKIVKDADF